VKRRHCGFNKFEISPRRTSLHSFDRRADMSFPSLTPYIVKRPWLMRWMKPLSEWYFDNAGYRKLGLRYVHATLEVPSRRRCAG